MRTTLPLILLAGLFLAATDVKAQPAPSVSTSTAKFTVRLGDILAALEKSRVLLKNDDRAGCRAILRELKVKLAESDRPLMKKITRQVQYIQLKLWMHMDGLARSHLVDLIDLVREEMRNRYR